MKELREGMLASVLVLFCLRFRGCRAFAGKEVLDAADAGLPAPLVFNSRHGRGGAPRAILNPN